MVEVLFPAGGFLRNSNLDLQAKDDFMEWMEKVRSPLYHPLNEVLIFSLNLQRTEVDCCTAIRFDGL